MFCFVFNIVFILVSHGLVDSDFTLYIYYMYLLSFFKKYCYNNRYKQTHSQSLDPKTSFILFTYTKKEMMMKYVYAKGWRDKRSENFIFFLDITSPYICCLCTVFIFFKEFLEFFCFFQLCSLKYSFSSSILLFTFRMHFSIIFSFFFLFKQRLYRTLFLFCKFVLYHIIYFKKDAVLESYPEVADKSKFHCNES